MASQETEKHQKPPAPRRTRTIGVRLTPAEIAALDVLISHQDMKITRAGAIANLTAERLIRSGLLSRNKDAGPPNTETVKAQKRWGEA